MSAALERFPDEILEHIAKVLADWKSGTEITRFFQASGHPEIRHDGSTKWKFVHSALRELDSRRYGQYEVAKIIERMVDSKQHIGTGDSRADIANRINDAICHMGIQVNRQGRLIITSERIAWQRSRGNGAPTQPDEEAVKPCRTIPAETRRQLLVEAGHRCAIQTCRVVSPLEAHHITPWSERYHHNPEDMIVLCSNCHGRAHRGT